MPHYNRRWGVLAAAVGVAGLAAMMARRRFEARLDRLQARLGEGRAPGTPRNDLPAAVFALAEASGARLEGAHMTVQLRQTGQMWRAPGGKPMNFSASQTIATTQAGFVWRAAALPFDSMLIADYFVGGHGGLEVKLFGAVTVAEEVGSSDLDKGEALRYLAELPWNPDAILHNAALEWRVVDSATISVAVGTGDARAEVTFSLGADGLVETASAASRIYIADGLRVQRPWRGRFWDYRLIEGRRLPTRGEVAWVLDGGDFVYWRGHIEAWATGPPS